MKKRAPHLLGLLFALVALFSSCAANVAAKFTQTGSVSISAKASIPPLLAAKLRALGGLAKDTPLFDLRAVKSSIAGWSGISLRSMKNTDPDSLALAVDIPDPAAALAASDATTRGLLKLTIAKGEREFAIHLERGQGSALAALAPGIDKDIIDAISPPALDSSDLNLKEYRQALGSILGTRILAELEAASVDCVFSFPGKIISSEGGKAEGTSWIFSIPILDLLVLEKPIDLRARWQQ